MILVTETNKNFSLKLQYCRITIGSTQTIFKYYARRSISILYNDKDTWNIRFIIFRRSIIYSQSIEILK